MHARFARPTLALLVASDVRLYGEALTRALARVPDLEVSGPTTSSRETIDALERMAPDVCLLDSSMRGGRRLARTIYEHPSGVKVVIVGIEDTESDILGWARAGMHAFVGRDNALEELPRVVRSVAAGVWHGSPTAMSTLLRHISSRERNASVGTAERALTPRERDVARLLARGHSNKQIAGQLGISVPTVKNHVHNILRKLGMHRRGEAADWVRGNLEQRSPRRPRSRSREERRG